jgi:hypothetical protein
MIDVAAVLLLQQSAQRGHLRNGIKGMLRSSSIRVVLALVCGFAIILFAAWSSGIIGEICEETKAGQEHCVTYNLASLILIQIFRILHTLEGVITALATAAIAWFTWTLWQSSEKMWNVTKLSAEASQKSADFAEKSLFEANRPLVAINPLELCDANEFQPGAHIHFGLKNVGKGVAIVNKVGVTVQTSMPRALTLTTNPAFFASDINSPIEPGGTLSGLYVASVLLGEREVQQIRSGQMLMTVILQIVPQDIFHNPFDQKFPFVFDHKQNRLARSSLIPEQKK